mmetsp:Transcript_27585/g.63937  ORF Transcript_27585/g.63937 Transcript_27585/m.63937 type:complete len:230 (+) Transcript_27585:61-750(+)
MKKGKKNGREVELLLFGWQFGDFANGHRLSFRSQGKSSQEWIIFISFYGYGSCQFQHAHNLHSDTGKAGLFVGLPPCVGCFKDFGHRTFLFTCVGMENGLETSRQNTGILRHVHQTQLANDFRNRSTGGFCTEHVAFSDILNTTTAPQLHQDIFSWPGTTYRHFVRPDPLHFVNVSRGHNGNLHARPHHTTLHLTHGDGTTIHVAIQHRNTQRRILIPTRNLQRIQQSE